MSPTEFQPWSVIGIPLLIFGARVLDVSLGTVRIVMVSRGNRNLAPILGFFEILMWLVALSQVVQYLDRPLHYLAYAGGFAAGTWIGLMVEDKMALGLLAVRIVTDTDATDLVANLSEQDFGVTSFAAKGVKGHVRFLLAIIRRRDLRGLQTIVQDTHPEAFVSISDVRVASRGQFPQRPGSLRSRLEMMRKK